MAKKIDTWMPFYIGDYLRDTTRLTTEQHGAYLLLLVDYWINGAPPDDDRVLSSIVKMSADRWKKARPVLLQFFRVIDGLWTQKRVDAEKAKASGISIERSEAGKAGAEAKKTKNSQQTDSKSQAIATANASDLPRIGAAKTQQTATPSPSPSLLRSTTALSPAMVVVEEFLRLRAALWPTESAQAAPDSTLATQAQQYLDAGAPPELVAEVVERVMRENHAKTHRAPTHLRFCHLTMATATVNHARAAPAKTAAPRADGRPEIELTKEQDRAWSLATEQWLALTAAERLKTPRPKLEDYATKAVAA